MTRDLHEEIGKVSVENLFAGLEPKALKGAGTIAKGSAEVTLLRGTLLGKKDGKLAIYGGESGVSPDCVLVDDTTVGTDADENVVVYIAGNFNESALIVADDYELTESDKDVLRTKGIIIGNSQNP